MANNSGVNLDISNLAVGFSIAGGTSKRSATYNGTGNQTYTAQQAIVLTLPNRATDTIVGYGDYSAKGVILVGTGAGTFTALAVGSNTQVLTADSTQASGVKWAAAAGGGTTYTNVNNAASPYTVLTTDQYISVDCSGGAVTLNFPNAPTADQSWIVKDRTGSAATNNITITTPGGTVTFDGATTYVINQPYNAINLIANATPTYEIY